MKNARLNGETLYRFKTSDARTSNEAEIAIVVPLEADGWTVFKNGWPDLFAVRDGVVRMIEIKPSSHRRLTKRQARLADALFAAFGVRVELAAPPSLGRRGKGRSV